MALTDLSACSLLFIKKKNIIKSWWDMFINLYYSITEDKKSISAADGDLSLYFLKSV